MKICKFNDPKRDECIRDSIQSFLPSLRGQVQNIDLPSVDPFSYDSMTFDYKNSNLLSGSFTVKDVQTFGMSRLTVKKVVSNFTENEMQIVADIYVPKIFSTGDYTSNMTFNLFQLRSKGKYNVTMKDVSGRWNIKGRLEKIDGEDYMKVYKFDLDPDAKSMKFSISGLFDDDTLSEFEDCIVPKKNIFNTSFADQFANDFFNQYWRPLYKEMIPETKKTWEPILLNETNKIFGQIPFRRLLIKE